MANYKISKEVRDQILKRVKEDGVPITEAAKDHGIHKQTIYNWLSKGATAQPTWRAMAKLKKENKMLLELLGEVTMKLSAAKKKK